MKWIRWAVVLVLLLAAAGHVAFWYLPRERVATPSPEHLPGRLLGAPGFSTAAWIAYPHQNLGQLERVVGDLEAYLGSVARLADVAEPRLPRFGPFSVPPAHEMGLASDRDGEVFVVAARVYPALALLARWAGRLANNPIMRGGEVLLGDRAASVWWEGDTWILSTADREVGGVAAAPDRPVTALVRLERPTALLPPGTYRLVREGEDMVFTSAPRNGGPAWSRAAWEERHSAAAILLDLPGAEAEVQGLALFPLGRREVGWPRAAAFGWGRQADWSLPGEAVFRLAGREPPNDTAGGWLVRALTPDSLRLGTNLAGGMDRLLLRAREDGLRTGLVVEIRPALDVARAVVRKLDDLPVAGPRLSARWRDFEHALTPASSYSVFSLVVTDAPPAAELRLWRHPPAGRD